MTSKLKYLSAGIAVLALATSLWANATAKQVTIDYCFVTLIDYPDIPAQESGKLSEIGVAIGAEVKKGATLGRLDDQHVLIQKASAEKEYAIAQAEADDTTDLEYSQAQLELAAAELEESEAIRRRRPNENVIPMSEIRKLRLAKRSAELRLQKSSRDQAKAQMGMGVQQAKVDAAELNLQRRKLISTIDGQVVRIYRQQGEWVNAGEPVFKVIRMNVLRVSGYVDAKKFNLRDLRDRDVSISVALAGDRQAEFSGKVVFVDPQIKQGNRLHVIAEVQNRKEAGEWLLPPGVPAKMRIEL